MGFPPLPSLSKKTSEPNNLDINEQTKIFSLIFIKIWMKAVKI